MISFKRCLAFTLLVLVTAPVLARQDPEPVRKVVDAFLQVQIRGLPGEVSYQIGKIAPNNRLAPCAAMDASYPAGAKAWGRTTVAVHCHEARGWTLFVPVHIRVITEYLVSAAPLERGRSLLASDLLRRRGDLSELPSGVLTNESDAIGNITALSIAAGNPLRSDMLRPPLVVQQNQSVRLVSSGSGFQVANEGRALTNGHKGQVVQVRLANGHVISGIAREAGVVEISF